MCPRLCGFAHLVGGCGGQRCTIMVAAPQSVAGVVCAEGSPTFRTLPFPTLHPLQSKPAHRPDRAARPQRRAPQIRAHTPNGPVYILECGGESPRLWHGSAHPLPPTGGGLLREWLASFVRCAHVSLCPIRRRSASSILIRTGRTYPTDPEEAQLPRHRPPLPRHAWLHVPGLVQAPSRHHSNWISSRPSAGEWHSLRIWTVVRHCHDGTYLHVRRVRRNESSSNWRTDPHTSPIRPIWRAFRPLHQLESNYRNHRPPKPAVIRNWIFPHGICEPAAHRIFRQPDPSPGIVASSRWRAHGRGGLIP